MSFISELDRIAIALIDELDATPFGKALFSGSVDEASYTAFLTQSYLYVRHTRPLLFRAGTRLEGDASRRSISALFLEKADEEDGHEQWVLDDLHAIGVPLDEVIHAAPEPSVAAYVAWNAFTVEQGSPIAFLGAAYVLEALSAARAGSTSKNLIERRRIRGIERATRFLRAHADADVGHKEHLGAVLEASAPLEDHRNIVLSAHVTRSTYAGLFEALGNRAAWAPEEASRIKTWP